MTWQTILQIITFVAQVANLAVGGSTTSPAIDLTVGGSTFQLSLQVTKTK